jgi:aspartyl-tRNA(Asn)/glutamyl-tRNA(Gln) amidotransferase subunit A
MASSTDVMGPLTTSVDDAAHVLEVMAHKDWHDSTMIERDKNDYAKLDKIVDGLRVGVVKEFFEEGVAPSVADSLKQAIDKLANAGAVIKEVSMPTTKSALAVYYVVVSAEVSSNLSRYDGMRYGPRVEKANLQESYIATRSRGFNDENRRRIIIGTYVLSSGYYDAYYSKAQKVRTLIKREFDEMFEKFDILIGPTAPTTAFKLGEKENDPLAMYMSDVLTVAPSLTGAPAISIPCGEDDQKLPIGLQMIANRGADRQLLSAAAAAEELLWS